MDNRFLDNWNTQLRKGILEMCVLNAIRDDRLYGYDIVKRLCQIEGLVMTEGTIYPILSRFKREGLVSSSIEESQSGPPRKYYQMTEHGRAILAHMNDCWSRIRNGTDVLREAE